MGGSAHNKARSPDAVQRVSGAQLIRGRRGLGADRLGACDAPGSAAHDFVLRCARETPHGSPQSNGSTFTIEAPWLLPTQSTGLAPRSSTKTRRILVERGS